MSNNLISTDGMGNTQVNTCITGAIIAGKKVDSDLYANLTMNAYGTNLTKKLTCNLSLQDEANPRMILSTSGITPTTVRISGISPPVNNTDCVTKKYMDDRILPDEVDIFNGITNAKKVENFNDLLVSTTSNTSTTTGTFTTDLSFDDTVTPMLRLIRQGDMPVGPYMNDVFISNSKFINSSNLIESPQGQYAFMTRDEIYTQLYTAPNYYPSGSVFGWPDASHLASTGAMKLNVRFTDIDSASGETGISAGTYKLVYKCSTVAAFTVKVYMLASTEPMNTMDFYMSNTDVAVPTAATTGWTEVLSTNIINTDFGTLREISFTTTIRHQMAAIVTSGSSKFGVLSIIRPNSEYRVNLPSTLTTSNGKLTLDTTDSIPGSTTIVNMTSNILANYIINTVVPSIRSKNYIVLSDTDNTNTTLSAKRITLTDDMNMDINCDTEVEPIMTIGKNVISLNRKPSMICRHLVFIHSNNIDLLVDDYLIGNTTSIDMSGAAVTKVQRGIDGTNPFTVHDPTSYFISTGIPIRMSFNVTLDTTNIATGSYDLLEIGYRTTSGIKLLYQVANYLPSTGSTISLAASGIVFVNTNVTFSLYMIFYVTGIPPGTMFTVRDFNLSMDEIVNSDITL